MSVNQTSTNSADYATVMSAVDARFHAAIGPAYALMTAEQRTAYSAPIIDAQVEIVKRVDPLITRSALRRKWSGIATTELRHLKESQQPAPPPVIAEYVPEIVGAPQVIRDAEPDQHIIDSRDKEMFDFIEKSQQATINAINATIAKQSKDLEQVKGELRRVRDGEPKKGTKKPEKEATEETEENGNETEDESGEPPEAIGQLPDARPAGDSIYQQYFNKNMSVQFDSVMQNIFMDDRRKTLFSIWKQKWQYPGDLATFLIDCMDEFFRRRGVDLQYIEAKTSSIMQKQYYGQKVPLDNVPKVKIPSQKINEAYQRRQALMSQDAENVEGEGMQ